MTVSSFQGISHVSFALSYLIALGLELAQFFRPRPVWRVAALAFGATGLVAHTVYILVHSPSPASPGGSLVLLSWVLALFYLYGTVHHAKQAWAVFVLPVVLGLVGLSFALIHTGDAAPPLDIPAWLSGPRFWGAVHGTLILLASVGVSVGFLASVMYLIQARRLRKKLPPVGGVRMLSLERLETMNRRALNLSFPLLTAGLLVGALILRHHHGLSDNWLSLKVVSTTGLWVVFLVLLYLRYGVHVSGRRLAVLSVFAFALLIVALGTAHPFADGGAK